MLHSLTIKNYATVAALAMEFKPGMSAITGETGAGKSIILGALGLTLGDRADRTVISGGADKAEISAEFDTRSINAAAAWLQERELQRPEQPGLCILRRVIHSDSRSRAFINDQPVTLANLKELGEMLLDIHSQHEHQSLLRRATHLRLLDDFGVPAPALDALHGSWQEWHANHRLLSELQQRNRDDTAEQELLGFQLQELDELALADGELAALEAECRLLDRADDLISSVQGALTLASGDGASGGANGGSGVSGASEETPQSRQIAPGGDMQSLLHQARALLQDGAAKDSRLGAVLSLLETATVQVDEAVAELRAFSDGFEADPARLEQLNARLARAHGLARKHKVEPARLPALTEELRARLEAIERGDEAIAELEAKDEALRQGYAEAAAAVTSARAEAAAGLAAAVSGRLAGLGMADASLHVALSPRQGGEPAVNGLETAEFLVVTNPGQPPKPLIKIASGGELSRISLAVQVVTAQTSQTPSLVFDEVDVGIGGGVAKVVGELLRGLGERTQILCVTHQPQVAGCAHQHLVVSKARDGKRALTRIVELSPQEKVREVARMLSGDDMSEESLAHASRMVRGG